MDIDVGHKQVKAEEKVDITYELPKLVDGLLGTMHRGINSGTLASAVLAAVATSLFVHIQEQMKFPNGGNELNSARSTPKGDLLVVFAYLAIIANCSATITSFLLGDSLNSCHIISARNDYVEQATSRDRERQVRVGEMILRYMGFSVGPLALYWSFTVYFGVLCIFAELLAYLWIVEPSLGVKVAITSYSVVAIWPLAINLVGGIQRQWTGFKGGLRLGLEIAREELDREELARGEQARNEI